MIAHPGAGSCMDQPSCEWRLHLDGTGWCVMFPLTAAPRPSRDPVPPSSTQRLVGLARPAPPLPTTPPPQAYPPLYTISTLSFLYLTFFAYLIHRVCSPRTLLRFLHQAWTPTLSNIERPSWIIRPGRLDIWPDRPPYRESPLRLRVFVRSHVPPQPLRFPTHHPRTLLAHSRQLGTCPATSTRLARLPTSRPSAQHEGEQLHIPASEPGNGGDHPHAL